MRLMLHFFERARPAIVAHDYDRTALYRLRGLIRILYHAALAPLELLPVALKTH